MCLLTNSSEVKIAKKSKKYIKVIGGKTINKTTWAPLYRPTCITTDGEMIYREYPFNKILDAEDDNNNKIIHLTIIKSQIGNNIICEGFHAHVMLAYDPFEKFHKYKIVVIPKGAEYVISTDGYDIVANKMIVFSNKFRYILYRLFGELTLCA